MINIGVTGTRDGFQTEKQFEEFVTFLGGLLADGEEIRFHHGDCIGVDQEAAIIAKELGCELVCHPPINRSLRAFVESAITMPELGYHARDRKIVESVDFLIVVPKQSTIQTVGGTWYTYHHAAKLSVPNQIIFP